MTEHSDPHYVARALYRRGDYLAAFEVYRQLACGGGVDEQIFVGWMCHMGMGVPKDDTEAMVWLTKAAASGSEKGMFYCGRLLTAKQQHMESVPWYERAAAKGYAPALYRLGCCYDRGLGVAVDERRALEYLVEAADRGHVFARRELALKFLSGKYGLVKRLKGVVLLLKTILTAIVLARNNAFRDELKG